MDYAPFYKTRMGEKFICKTVPDLIKAVDRLAGSVEGNRDPRIQELIEHAGYLVEGVERVLILPIEPRSVKTREAFDLLRGQAAAVRLILKHQEQGR